MSERQFSDTGQLSKMLSQLAHQIANASAHSPETVLQQSVDGLVTSGPFTAAAILSTDSQTGDATWTQRAGSGAGTGYFDQLGARQGEMLEAIRRNQKAVQYDVNELAGEDTPAGKYYFIAVPVGNVAGSPCSLGMFSDRRLSSDEIEQLVSFGQILGLKAENARLTGLHAPNGGHSSAANLIGLIAHELRTPLTGMRGNIQLALMSNQKGQTERIPERLQAAISSVDAMASLVQKLLDVSRLERGNFETNVERADLRGTVMAAIDDAPGGQDLSGELIRLADGNPVEHEHDRQALGMVLTYLLSAALEQREPDTSLAVSVSADEGTRVIEITYRGSPLSENDREALVRPLHERQPRSTSGKSQELSLEMAYARGVVQYHHGWITPRTDENDQAEQAILIHLPAEHQG